MIGKKDGLEEKRCILKIVKKAKYHKKEKTANMNDVSHLISINHPNLLKLENFSMSTNHFYFITDYITGKPNQKALPIFECLIK